LDCDLKIALQELCPPDPCLKYNRISIQDNKNGFKKVPRTLITFATYQKYLAVLDLVSQIRDVVLVRCIFNSGNPRGLGFWNGEGMGRGWK
jgi:hypothetical protein